MTSSSSEQANFYLEFSRTLRRATDSTALFAAIGRKLLRYFRARCIVFRDLHGTTVLGPPIVFYQSRPGRPLQIILDTEPALSRAALDQERIRTRSLRIPGVSVNQFHLLSTPLLWLGRACGIMTIAIPEPSAPTASERRHLLRSVHDLAELLGHALAGFAATEQRDLYCHETRHQLQELTTLLHISRTLHSTRRVNEVIPFLLSAATVASGGEFGRAALFMVNERTESLQGLLGITNLSARLVLPLERGPQVWDHPQLDPALLREQRRDSFSLAVRQLRLPLSERTHPMTRCLAQNRVVLVNDPPQDSADAAAFADILDFGSFACAPLQINDTPLAVMVFGTPPGTPAVNVEHRKFIEIFSRLAAASISNSLLLRRLEGANRDLKQTQERLLQGEKLALLGEMAASIAHEIKTPLITMGGFARRLAQSPAAAQAASYAEIIGREAKRLEELLEGVLAFARKPQLCYSSCNLQQLVDETLHCQADHLANQGISVRVEGTSRLPRLQADVAKLRQVLLNLVTNAQQAMPQGGEVVVRYFPSRFRSQPAITLTVSDSGGGIPVEHRPWIFTPFYSTKEGGTGLGLPIAARIVEEHGGHIEVDNRGNGALFTVILPCRDETQAFH